MRSVYISIVFVLGLLSCTSGGKGVVHSSVEAVEVGSVVADSVVTKQLFITTLHPNYAVVIQP